MFSFTFSTFCSVNNEFDSYLWGGITLCLKAGKTIVKAATIPDRMHPIMKGNTFSVDQLH